MKTLFLTISFAVATSLCAQPPGALWTRRINFDGSSRCDAVLAIEHGHFLVGGHLFGSRINGILLSESGDSLVTYQSQAFQGSITALARTESGRTVSFGTDLVYSMHQWVPQAAVCWRDAEGQIEQWCQNYLGPIQIAAPGASFSRDFTLSSDGGMILVGRAAVSTWGDNDDFWATRVTANGDTIWNGGFDIAYDQPNAVAATSDDGCVITGLISAATDNPTEIALLRLDPSGDSLWFRHFGGSGNDEGRDVLVLPDGELLVAGYITDSDDLPHASLLRTNANGDSLWHRTYGGAGSAFHALRPSTQGGYVAAGYTSANSQGGKDFLLFKVNSEGDSIWSTTFGGAGDDICNALDLTLDSGYVLAGTTTSYDSLGTDWWVVRTAIDLDADLSQLLPFTVSLFQNYPNPFNASTDIRFELAKASNIALRIFDLNGREMATLTEGMHNAGAHNIRFDASTFAAGIYFYRLEAGEIFQTKKMVLLK